MRSFTKIYFHLLLSSSPSDTAAQFSPWPPLLCFSIISFLTLSSFVILSPIMSVYFVCNYKFFSSQKKKTYFSWQYYRLFWSQWMHGVFSYYFFKGPPVMLQNWETIIKLFVSVKHENILLFNLLATSFGRQTIIRPSFHGILKNRLHYCTSFRLPWLRFFRAFSSVVRQMPGGNSQRWGTARTLPH